MRVYLCDHKKILLIFIKIGNIELNAIKLYLSANHQYASCYALNENTSMLASYIAII